MAAALLISLALMVLAASLYHWVFLKGAREGWPVIGAVVKLMTRDEAEQRERFVRENLDAMARKVGELQAKLVQMESLGERLSGLAGIPVPPELKAGAGRGGALLQARPLTMEELQSMVSQLDQITDKRADLMTVMESRLFDQKMARMLQPTQHPVSAGVLGSAFGWRIDPFNGRQALHTGLDFQAETGTPIHAAAGGIVVTQEFHPAYGNMVEIDHGNDLITRYAHASKVDVKKGDIVRRGQKIAEVGTSGRSTGPHLHFEVLVQGVPQDPMRFLRNGRDTAVAAAPVAPAANRPGGPVSGQ